MGERRVSPWASAACAWVGLILSIILCGSGALGAETWPNCSFNCTAKDVTLVSAYADVPAGSCEPGSPITATIRGVFSANATRYAVIVLADVYVGGAFSQHIEQCVVDTISVGTSDQPLTSMTWPCGATLELRNLVVSWAATSATCADPPRCSERGAKCSKPALGSIVVATPLVADFTTNSPQCVGSLVSFTSHVSGGATPYTYQWTFGDGVGGSTLANPTYIYAFPGTYTVDLVVRDSKGATDSHTYPVTILPPPFPTAANDGPYCPGQTIHLSASGGASYSWTGPGGFTSAQQNPTIPNASAANAGTYTVTVTNASGCSAQATTNVTVNPLPSATATNGGPCCVGQTIQLSASGGASYSWTGPGGFTSAQQNPTIPNASAANAGTYTVTVSNASGCSAQATTNVTVNPLPSATATNGGPYCVGQTIQLSASGGASYSWTGPGGFTSAQQNPTIPNASATNAGTYTVTVTNASGCSSQASTSVVFDSTPPVLVAPANMTATCGSSTSPTAAGQATATDNQDPNPTVAYSDVASLTGCGGTGTITRTWRAADACGNTSTGVQTITVVDTTAPSLSVPPNVTVQCGSPTAPSATGTATATDTCTPSPGVTFTDVSSLTGCGGTGTITRTWRATDACGNTSTGVQRVTVVDTTAPTLALPPNTTVPCGGSTSPSATGTATATDACTPSPTVTFTDVSSLTGCGGTGTITRTWRATDACGNASTGVQTITVVDTTAPSLTVPADLTLDCGHPTDPSATGTASATDACSSPVVTHSDVTSLAGCGGAGTITRTWRATDACGNVTMGTQTITVVDAIAPSLVVPTDVTVECGHSADPLVTGQAIATDACGAAAVSYSDTSSLTDCGGTGTITRTWRAADACGNVSTGVQTITVVDRTAPSLSIPPDVTVDCGRSTDPSATGRATATDTCASPVVTYSDQVNLTACAGTGTITRTWRAADACGNVSADVQTIAVVDETAPNLTVPADVTVQSGHSTDPSSTGQGTATDACSSPVVTYTDQANLSGPGGSGTITRTWTTTDACGNVSTGVQTINVVTAPPPPILVLRVPPDVTMETGDPTDPSATGQATTSDTCPTPPTLTYTDQSDLTGCDETGTITRTWRATDACGNVATGIQTITVVDTSVPVLTVPADVTVDCGQPIDPSGNGTASATDPHGEEELPTAITYTDQANLTGCGGTGTIVRTWKATEACGNSSTGVQTITVVDRTPPALTVPANVTVAPGESTDPTATGAASTADACTASPTITYSDQSNLAGCDETGTITRTWGAIDACGNVATGVQTITVADTSLPVLTVPVDTTVDCGQPTDPSATGTATATDPHGEEEFPTTISYTDQVNLTGCGGTGTIVRTWKATEACGNSSTGVQTITVVDRTPPTLTAPADVSVACGSSTDPSVTGQASAVDACTGSPTLGYSDSSTSTSCSGAATIVRTWKATDACGNVATGVQRITPVNHAPVANPDSAATPQGQSVVVVVSTNDVDVDGNISPSTVVVVSGPAHGTATVDPTTGNVTYTPSPTFTGVDTFVYRICDTGGLCSSAQVTVTVTPVNHPPVANDETTILPEGTPTALVLTGTDPDGNPVTYHLVTSPSHGTISAFDPATGHLIYTPQPGYGGPDSFQFEVCDSLGACARANVFLTVTKVDRPPVAIPQNLTTDENVLLPITLEATDEEPLTYQIVSLPSHGILVGLDPATGTLIYVTDPDYNGPDAFVFRACDPTGSCASAPVSITVRPVNSPPVAVSTNLVVPEGLPSDLGLIAHDPEGDPLTYQIVQDPRHGTITSFDPATGRLTYTPNPGYRGPDTIVFRVCAPSGACAEGVVQLLVVGAGGAGGTVGGAKCSARLIISEVAWAGTAADPTHEWIELRNLEEAPVDLTGWTLRIVRKRPQSDADRLWKLIALSGEIGAAVPSQDVHAIPPAIGSSTRTFERLSDWKREDFCLLERANDRAVSDIPADLVYDDRLPLSRTLDLSDAGETIELVDPYGCVADTANADHPERDGWAAGDLAARATMERTDPQKGDLDPNWHTNLGLFVQGSDAKGRALFGTARGENSPLLGTLLGALSYEATKVLRGDTLGVPLPGVAAGPGEEGARALVTRPATGADEPSDPVTPTYRQEGAVTVLVIDATALIPGPHHVWVRYVRDRVLFAPIEVVP